MKYFRHQVHFFVLYITIPHQFFLSFFLETKTVKVKVIKAKTGTGTKPCIIHNVTPE